MNQITEIRQLVSEAKNIYLIPPQTNEPESLAVALAFFYALRGLDKNVNLIIEDFPEKLNFLIPSLDFISSPKNFVISIPRSIADISQIYYEKNENDLKIHLTIGKGRVKKESVDFYFSEPKPDLIVTLGIRDLKSQLSNKLDSFGFLLDVPVLNIDTLLPAGAAARENKKFGSINLVEPKSISEIVLDIIKSFYENTIDNNIAKCLLTGLVVHYENFKSVKMGSDVFQICGDLVGKGANYHQIIENLYKTTEAEINFLGKLFQNIKTGAGGVSVSMLDDDSFQNFAETEAHFAVEKLKAIGMQNDLLALWKSHASPPVAKGFFYSKKPELINKIGANQQIPAQNDWVFLSIPESDINSAKDKILGLL